MNEQAFAAFLRDLERQVREGVSREDIRTQLLQWAETIEGRPQPEHHIVTQQREGHQP